MSRTRPCALHAEIARRAAHHVDRIAQATGTERHRAIAQAARDIGTWAMIANELGWSVLGEAATVSVTKPLFDALAARDLLAPPESAEDWARCRTSAAATRDRALAHARENQHDDAAWAYVRALRAIHAALELAHARWAKRHPDHQQPEERHAA